MASSLCAAELASHSSLTRHVLLNTQVAGESLRSDAASFPSRVLVGGGRKCNFVGGRDFGKDCVRHAERLYCQRPAQGGPVRAVASAENSVVDVPLESDAGVSYELLRDKLAQGQWEEADNETRRLLCVLAGEGAVKRKWVYFTEVQFIPAKDLLTIDSLWRAYSGDRYGYSIQRKIWNASGRRWKDFFAKIGWTKGSANSYLKFPMEFLWNNDQSTPVGHLPLTNALRGTQLLESVLSHPAFEIYDRESELPVDDVSLPSNLFDGSAPTESASSSSERKPNIAQDLLSEIDYGF